jgi:hypothetical protein
VKGALCEGDPLSEGLSKGAADSQYISVKASTP